MSFKICFEYFATVEPPGGFFHFHQNALLYQLYDLGPSNSDFVTIKTQKRFITSSGHCLDVTTHPNEPDQLLKEVIFPRFSEKNTD